MSLGSVNYPVYMPTALYQEVHAAADREHVSAAEWIRRAIREKLDRDAHGR